MDKTFVDIGKNSGAATAKAALASNSVTSKSSSVTQSSSVTHSSSSVTMVLEENN